MVGTTALQKQTKDLICAPFSKLANSFDSASSSIASVICRFKQSTGAIWNASGLTSALSRQLTQAVRYKVGRLYRRANGESAPRAAYNPVSMSLVRMIFRNFH